ncbi:MAG TPA: hypothetical protein VGA55_02755, partial [Bacteroidota bacterium]
MMRLALTIVCAVAIPLRDNPPSSEWVFAGTGGKLVYKTTPRGDRILDFSHAGYMGGGVDLPTVPVRQTVQPSEDDITDAIQAAIDEVGAMALEDGFRGAVLLEPGIFHVSRTLRISENGVVLRGSGSRGETRSTLKLSGEPFLAIAVRENDGQGGSGVAGQELPEAKTTIQ